MAILTALAPDSSPRICSEVLENRVRVSNLKQRELGYILKLYRSNIHGGGKGGRLGKLNAGLTEIEPDLNEDPTDRWATNSVSAEDFRYGEWDGHHTYHEGDEKKGTFWGGIADDIRAVESPTGFQGLIAWLFLPTVAAAMYFNAPGEYIYIGAALFIIVFTIIEMDKPDKPHNFEPQIYNMERGARDKLINDYNTMNIWEFNEKYGDVWDFTVKKDDITKR